MKLSPIEELAYITVRIETESFDGGIGCGTGFFYSIHYKNDKHIHLIITNKHVVNNAKLGSFLLTMKTKSGEPDLSNRRGYQISDFKDAWTPHPDSSIDLCAMPIAELVSMVNLEGGEFYYKTFDSSIIPDKSEVENFIGMEEIKMIGYPDGIWDEVNNMPVFRRGTLASNIRLDWKGRKEFLIDAATFPGSSGSPILIMDLAGFTDKNGTYIGKSRYMLLGILYGVFMHTIKGDVKIAQIPADTKIFSESLTPNNLGIAIKSEELLVFDEIFRAEEKRRTVEQ